jgi:hypothetical protein
LLGCFPAAQAHAATVTFYLKNLQFPTSSRKDGTVSKQVQDIAYSIRVRGYATSDTTGLFLASEMFLTNNGVGVCNDNEMPTCPTGSYAVDNLGWNDWVLFTFDTTAPGGFESIVIGAVSDVDATYWTGTLTNPEAGLDAMTFGAFVTEFGKGTDTKDGQTRIGPLGSGNFLLFGAHKPMDLPDTEADYFLLHTLTATMPAVPAPTSLVLFASGLALMAGLRIRRLTGH